MYNKAFDASRFLGYVNVVSPQKVGIHFPSAALLPRFRHEGVVLAGGNVGEFVLIEGERYGFLAKITELQLPDSERKSLSEKAVHEENSIFHPIATAELLLSFSVVNPTEVERTISRFPEIGAKVYSCSSDLIRAFMFYMGSKLESSLIRFSLGSLVSSNTPCMPSLNSIFGRHCAVVGTTGSGKSWTVARLVEAVVSQTKNSVILFDPTGEYSSFDEMSGKTISKVVGEGCYFPYEHLKVSDLFCLLRPTAQSQRPILMEAIRSLKTVRIAEKEGVLKDGVLKDYVKDGVLEKLGKLKKPIIAYQWKHKGLVDDMFCDFDITKLNLQINNECIYSANKNNPEYWGGKDDKTYDYQSSLKFRIGELLSSKDFDGLFHFRHQANGAISLIELFKDFFSKEALQLLRLDFSKTSSAFNAREIVANAVAKRLYDEAKNEEFKATPVIIVLDEAHLFLNKSLYDAEQTMMPLDSFDLIAKECRKFGLFICLSTQMPRDIPVGTLSQVGTFIVHRLINEQDRRVIETACSSATHSSLSYLPILGAGEALLTGVDFPMSIMVKIKEPSIHPNSGTPLLTTKSIEQE